LTAASEHLAREQQLLDEYAAGDHPRKRLVWESERALVVSQLDTHLPRFMDAMRASAAEGWPVTLRKTGGSAVAIGPGVVNFSVVDSWRGTQPTLAYGFDLVCTPVIRALAHLGVTGTTGAAPGAFCDGKYNVLVDGRKIAGTAQRCTRRGPGGALLAQAMLIVDADPAELTSAVARFYERAGSDRTFDARAVTSIERCLAGRPIDNLRATLAGWLGGDS